MNKRKQRRNTTKQGDKTAHRCKPAIVAEVELDCKDLEGEGSKIWDTRQGRRGRTRLARGTKWHTKAMEARYVGSASEAMVELAPRREEGGMRKQARIER